MKRKIAFLALIAIFVFALAACGSTTCTVRYVTGILPDYEESVDTRTVYLLPEKEIEGYVFDGWYRNQSLSQGSRVEILQANTTGTVTLYGKFTKIFQITYITDGEHDNPTEVLAGKSIFLHDATKEGFKFEGWYPDAEYEGEKVTSIGQITEDLTLYGKFSHIYSITYDLQEGENSPRNPLTYVEGTSVTLSEPHRNGYSFVGWFDEDGTEIKKIDESFKRNLQLRAEWTEGEYAIVWNLNGGAVNGTLPATYTYGEGVSSDKFLFPTRQGYVFTGWYAVKYSEATYCTEITPEEYGKKDIRATWIEATGQINTQNMGYSQSGLTADRDTKEVVIAGRVNVPDSLSHMLEEGRLHVKIEVDMFANARMYGDKQTAYVTAYFKVDDEEYDSVVFTTATGRSDSRGNPVAGDWKFGDGHKTYDIKLSKDSFSVGYKYHMMRYSNDEAYKCDVRFGFGKMVSETKRDGYGIKYTYYIE